MIRILFTATLILASLSWSPASAQSSHALTCDGYDAWIWAQAVYESDPRTYAQLDPDGNGIACEHLSVAGFPPVLWADSIPADATPAQLIRVTDGDTIVVLVDGVEERVRLAHIDAPELQGEGGQCGATESHDYLAWMLGLAKNGTVYLDRDVSERDRYDRLLAYVWFSVDGDPNPYMANDAMVLTGWAQSKTWEPDIKYKEQLDASEQFSVDYVTGVRLLCGKFGQPLGSTPSAEQVEQAWRVQPNQGQLPAGEQPVQQSVVNPPPAQPTAVPVDPAPAAVQSADCDPSYPSVCIPPKWQVGDLDCKDISHRRFTVLPPDPHNFDGDYDGVGCEGG